MCGLTGMLVGSTSKRRSKADLQAIGDKFTRLLVLSEHRGPFATGVALIDSCGNSHVFKAPVPAREFVASDGYRKILDNLDDQATLLMGHTRWPSRGSVLCSAENHPLSAPPVLLTHNGTIAEHARHFSRLGLCRTTQVDSELLARIAQRYAGSAGLDVESFLDALAPLDGSMSLALAATTHPEELILVKGNMPLEVRISRSKRLVMYASEDRVIEAATRGAAGWQEIPVAPGEALVFTTAAIHAPRRSWFTFRGLRRHAAHQWLTGE